MDSCFMEGIDPPFPLKFCRKYWNVNIADICLVVLPCGVVSCTPLNTPRPRLTCASEWCTDNLLLFAACVNTLIVVIALIWFSWKCLEFTSEMGYRGKTRMSPGLWCVSWRQKASRLEKVLPSVWILTKSVSHQIKMQKTLIIKLWCK